MQIDEDKSYIREGVKLIVEQQEESLVITYAQLEVVDMYNLCIEFIDRMAKITKQDYNAVVEDLKEITGEKQ